MRVKSLELTNLKSFVDTKIELSENINLLIGANNSGKSTIVKALLNLQYRCFNTSDIRSQQTYAKTLTTIGGINEVDNKLFYHPSHHNEFEIGSEFSIAWGQYNLSEREEHLYFNSKHKFKRDKGHRIVFKGKEQSDKVFKQFARFPDVENKNNFIYPFLAKRKTDYYDVRVNQEQTYKVFEGLRNLAAKIQKVGNLSHPKFEEFLFQCDNILGFRIGVIPTGQNNSEGIEPGIYVTNNSLVPLRAMGEGIANIIGFIVTLLTEDNKLFLIEELENDIQLTALKKLLELIITKSKNNQFVISTHSNIVLKNLGVVTGSKIFYLDWSPWRLVGERFENIHTTQITEVENNPHARIQLLQKLGYDFHDFDLFEAYLILEESSAETVIRDFLIPNIVPSLYNKIKTIAAKGVDDLKPRVIDFHRLFVYLHTNPIYKNKAWVVADGDDVGLKVICDLKATFKSWPDEHFINFSKHNFERYYPVRFSKKVQAIDRLNHSQKLAAKKELLDEVMGWSLTNREEAVQEFGVSANEVVELLKKINRKLKK